MTNRVQEESLASGSSGDDDETGNGNDGDCDDTEEEDPLSEEVEEVVL
jgi:hypothetical protein